MADFAVSNLKINPGKVDENGAALADGAITTQFLAGADALKALIVKIKALRDTLEAEMTKKTDFDAYVKKTDGRLTALETAITQLIPADGNNSVNTIFDEVVNGATTVTADYTANVNIQDNSDNAFTVLGDNVNLTDADVNKTVKDTNNDLYTITAVDEGNKTFHVSLKQAGK